ncbi:regulator of nonsense transcripts 1, putative [Trichomonas vaginalis G3]|uniref:Regulator of nonsense transcripts 1, putative n=1 Tax=Trichomonas vaginalis (strain ATCC PRA-98 / G3) TaxID=412133 RepID=A2F3Q1_TRIV3|nr:nuclear-transcribed mRNA catabolic process, nonsense-mediated decay [Trichomonas vaginalis G3]EAY00469.1 regulator of nonsense transcripts 1, putative [Trichomonas vaginalis G3]KAI5494858.1 nuclear-transcribed mRNA catabolic process, nonsense-mediated decay [Trichomonas vaginalis G3]|eukprot:XP_001313398.1 regulator of nonsense transcripts 1 [Trichomonas vaginalis G3]
MKDKSFDTLIVDECSQSVDPEVIIPLLKTKTRLILVGDQKQLPPLLFAKESKIAKYDNTIIDRLEKLNIAPQFRMHPSISQFPSAEFYDSKVADGISQEYRTKCLKWIQWPNNGLPILFWEFKGKPEEKSSDGKSNINRDQVQCVANLIDILVNKANPSDIGVISPYSGQNFYLRDNLHRYTKIAGEDYIKRIEISSIDSFQGREKELIIFSTVKSNNTYDIGFLNDERSLNVALTRARCGLIIIGDSNTFIKSKNWLSLLRYYSSHRCLCSGTVNNWIPKSFSY